MDIQDRNQHGITTETAKLLKILIDHLQTDPYAPIREYISNAYDATVGEANAGIYINGKGNKLSILDEGAGMTKEVILKAFTRIGGSFKTKGDLSTIGMFGIGVLSAFIAARKIVVKTRSEQEEHGWLLDWERYQDIFSLEPYDKEEKGTEAILEMDEDSLDLANNIAIRGFIERTFALLTVPIHLGTTVQNILANPLFFWIENTYNRNISSQLLHSNEAYKLMAKFSHLQLISVFYKQEKVIIKKEDGSEQEDFIRIFFGIPLRPHEPLSRHSIKFFSRGVLVHEDVSNFYPENLAFVVGLVDSPKFKLQITRERIFIQDDHFQEIKRRIEDYIIEFLELITSKDKAIIRQVLNTHRTMLVSHVAGNARNQRLINLFKSNYTFSTSNGELNWNEILPFLERQGAERILYVTSSELETIRDITTSTTANKFLVVYALGPERAIIDEIAKQENVVIQDPKIASGLEGVADVPAPFRKLANSIAPYLGRRSIGAVIFVQLPGDSDIPSVFRITTVQGEKMIGLQSEQSEYGNKSLQVDAIMLNISNPLIRTLAGKKEISRSNFQLIADVLYQTALIHSPFVTMSQEFCKELIQNLTLSLKLQVGIKAKPQKENSEKAYCFVALPYSGFENIWEGACQVLSSLPYNWNVIRADRLIQDTFLLPNVQGHIKKSHRFIADISGLNPNVMIELGMMVENFEEGLLILCDESTSQTIPADLRGKLLVVYPDHLREDKEAFAALFTEKIKAFDDWVTLTGLL